MATGPGTLTFGGANTFSGGTTIGGGTLWLGNSGALQNSTLTPGAAGDLGFLPNIGAFTLGALAGTAGFALADANGNAVTLSVGGNNQSTIFAGALSGSGALLKLGGGDMVLSGTNTYGGGTTVAAGTLTAAATASLPSFATVTVAAGATLAVYPTGSWTTSVGALLTAASFAPARTSASTPPTAPSAMARRSPIPAGIWAWSWAGPRRLCLPPRTPTPD